VLCGLAMNRMHAPFEAPLWLRNSHLQTLAVAAPFFSPPKWFATVPAHVRIPLPGAGSLHARAYWQPREEPKAAVLLVHGLGGTSQSLYVVRAAVALHRAGFHVVCLDLRGIAEGLDDAPALYHAGLTEDPRVAADWVAEQPGVSGVVLVGFSMGGHVAVRLAGELGGDVGPIRGIVAISAPLDLHAVSRAIARVRSLPYHAYVLRHLVGHALAFARRHPDRAHYDVTRVRRLRSVRSFDETVSAPMHGFQSVDDYYRRAAAGPFVPHIRIPTLLLHAEDDPMVPPWCVRPWLDHAPNVVEQQWSAHGGHVGWFGGLREDDWVETWAVRKAREFAERVTRA
jgi:predicted alpha/beta-fold hydrolase